MVHVAWSRSKKGFTLVELLVVIGIIAVLISVLLPALQSARRSANTIKCAAALREIGNAVKMYAQDYKGYAPPLRCLGVQYNMNGINYPLNGCYWYNFLEKYVTKGKVGNGATTAQEAAEARRSIFWSCPAWDGYVSTAVGGLALQQTGYGWNAFPEYTSSFPGIGEELGEGGPPERATAVSTPTAVGNWGTYTNKWYKLGKYTHPAERAMVSDAAFYVLEARPVDTSGVIVGQTRVKNALWVPASDGPHQATYDFYRHGKYPSVINVDQFSPNGGKVAYNVLFVDGHTATLVDRSEGYKAVRQRFPG